MEYFPDAAVLRQVQEAEASPAEPDAPAAKVSSASQFAEGEVIIVDDGPYER